MGVQTTIMAAMLAVVGVFWVLLANSQTEVAQLNGALASEKAVVRSLQTANEGWAEQLAAVQRRNLEAQRLTVEKKLFEEQQQRDAQQMEKDIELSRKNDAAFGEWLDAPLPPRFRDGVQLDLPSTGDGNGGGGAGSP